MARHASRRMDAAATSLSKAARERRRPSFIALRMQKQDQGCWRLASSRTTIFHSKLDGFRETARGKGLSLELDPLIRSLQVRRRQPARHSVDKAFKLFFLFGL